MIYKEFPRAFEQHVFEVTGNNFTGKHTENSHAGYQLSNSKDGKSIGFRISYFNTIQWENGSKIIYQQAAIVELPKGEEKPALVFLLHIARDNQIELNERFQSMSGFNRFNLPKKDIVFSQKNIDTIKRMWENFSL